ncbi:sugar phosphate isomerase/epimerase family protein [Actinacidiphila rubida]|uniref:Sugar phosphate isomerase/epimerase n=1 Tax=Actinacidiphila rubida TaxID=310780 RepID=A0A1H8ENS5_9ACTN|nr:TIM barrel protein [Actinacidiphila rubida]SEN20438.1 Sugar phosphate isomerase/epimerase [Actinacidiphila rubida]
MLAVGMAVYSDLDWRSAVDRAAAEGYRALDLQLDSDSLLTQSMQRDGTAVLARHLAHRGLTVACVSNVRDTELLLGPHTAHTDALCPGDAPRKEAHARAWAHRVLTWAQELSAPLVRMYFGCPDHLLMFPWHGYPADWPDNVRIFASKVAGIAADAESRGLRLCVETHPRQALFRVAAIDQARARFARDGLGLGLCFDPANIEAGNLDAHGYLGALSPAPEVVHLKDVEIWRASTPPPGPGWRSYGPGAMCRFRDFGRGQLDWDRLGRGLTAAGFTGTLVAEFEDATAPRAVSILRATAAIRDWIRANGW